MNKDDINCNEKKSSNKKKLEKFQIFTSYTSGDRYGNMPIHIACIYGNHSVLNKLFDKKAISQVTKNKYEIKRICKSWKTPNQDELTPIALAIIHNRVKCLEQVIEIAKLHNSKFDINKKREYLQGYSMIGFAVLSLVKVESIDAFAQRIHCF